jgi:hypothetical protein
MPLNNDGWCDTPECGIPTDREKVLSASTLLYRAMVYVAAGTMDDWDEVARTKARAWMNMVVRWFGKKDEHEVVEHMADLSETTERLERATDILREWHRWYTNQIPMLKQHEREQLTDDFLGAVRAATHGANPAPAHATDGGEGE